VTWSIHRLPETRGQLGSLTAALIATFAPGLFSEAQAACKLEEISELHVERVGNSPIIDGQINAQPIRILLETGSNFSYITFTAAHQLGLPVREYVSHTAYSAEGNESVKTANVKELHIGQFLLKDYTLNVVGKEIRDGNGVASFQLGADFFSHFTTEFDFLHGVVRLMHPQDCKLEQLAYWSQTYFQIDLQHFDPDNPSFMINIKVNGKPQLAQLVSGSATSYISLDAAKEAGVETNSPGVEAAEPFVLSGATPIPTWTGRFDTIEFGAETIKNAHLRIGDVFPHGKGEILGSHMPVQYGASHDVKLGSDFFQAHRIMVVPDKHIALFTYNGGAVF
jgi:predicted aspartyl protease